MDDITQLFLRHSKAEPIKHTKGTNMSWERWKIRVRTWKEATTTSPSGQYLSHFKVLLCRHSMSLDTDEGQELTSKQNKLLDAQAGMLQ
eukprot:3327122-Ditylum_brightwellii.AAC.1